MYPFWAPCPLQTTADPVHIFIQKLFNTHSSNFNLVALQQFIDSYNFSGIVRPTSINIDYVDSYDFAFHQSMNYQMKDQFRDFSIPVLLGSHNTSTLSCNDTHMHDSITSIFGPLSKLCDLSSNFVPVFSVSGTYLPHLKYTSVVHQGSVNSNNLNNNLFLPGTTIGPVINLSSLDLTPRDDFIAL